MRMKYLSIVLGLIASVTASTKEDPATKLYNNVQELSMTLLNRFIGFNSMLEEMKNDVQRKIKNYTDNPAEYPEIQALKVQLERQADKSVCKEIYNEKIVQLKKRFEKKVQESLEIVQENVQFDLNYLGPRLTEIYNKTVNCYNDEKLCNDNEFRKKNLGLLQDYKLDLDAFEKRINNRLHEILRVKELDDRFLLPIKIDLQDQIDELQVNN